MRRLTSEPNDLERLFVERYNAGDLEGLVRLYEPGAIVAGGNGGVVAGYPQIREFLAEFMAQRPLLEPGIQAPALANGGIALTSSRSGNGDITAEVARRQPDGSWLWVIDQFAIGRVRSS